MFLNLVLFKQEVYYTDLIESLSTDIASDDGKYLENFKVKKRNISCQSFTNTLSL